MLYNLLLQLFSLYHSSTMRSLYDRPFDAHCSRTACRLARPCFASPSSLKAVLRYLYAEVRCASTMRLQLCATP